MWHAGIFPTLSSSEDSGSAEFASICCGIWEYMFKYLKERT